MQFSFTCRPQEGIASRDKSRRSKHKNDGGQTVKQQTGFDDDESWHFRKHVQATTIWNHRAQRCGHLWQINTVVESPKHIAAFPKQIDHRVKTLVIRKTVWSQF